MSENRILSRYIFLFLVLLILALVYMAHEAKATNARPPYTLFDAKHSFLFSNHESLPFQVIREMCWNATEGFCEDLTGMQEIRFLVHWNTQAYGAVFETDSGECFWWMYQSEWGEDNNPHIAEHYWIECPMWEWE